MTRRGAFYESFETAAAGFRMGLKMVVLIVFLVAIGQAVFIYFRVAPEWEDLHKIPVPVSGRPISADLIQSYYLDLTFGLVPEIRTPDEFAPLLRAGRVWRPRVRKKYLYAIMDRITPRFAAFRGFVKRQALASCGFQGFTIFFILMFYRASRRGRRDDHIRGTRLISAAAMAARLNEKTRHERGNISIGGLPLPRENETAHILVLGATGTGKSVLINQMLHSIATRQSAAGAPPEKMIIYDVKGDFLSKWYNPGGPDRPADIIFYPFDSRTINYSLFSEIRNDVDFMVISRAIFPRIEGGQGGEAFFVDAACSVFEVGLIFLNCKGRRKNRDIYEFFSKGREAILQAIRELPAIYHAACSYIEEERQGAAVISTIQQHINFFRFMGDSDGNFSFRDYIRDEADRRNLFILNLAAHNSVFKPLLTFAVDIMIREVLSMADDRARRVWFVLDEFGSLGRLGSVFSFLKESRSKGGALILANQDLGDVAELYGKHLKETFYNNFNVNILFRVNSPEAAQFLSNAIGEREVHQKLESRSMSPSDVGDRRSISTQDKREAALLPSEFLQLKNLHAVLKVSDAGISKLTVPKVFFPCIAAPYQEKPFGFALPPPEE